MTLGLGYRLVAAQLSAAATEQIPGLMNRIEKGEFQPLLQWLLEHVRRHGRCYHGQNSSRWRQAKGVRRPEAELL